MSLKNGLKKRTPLWCWLMIVAQAFVVLPGAVAQHKPDEKRSEETASDSDIKARRTVVSSAPQVEVSTETYKVGDLFERLAEEHGLSSDEAPNSLIRIFEKAIPPVIEMPQEFPGDPKVAASPSLPAIPARRQLSSISLNGDVLVVVQSDTGHAKLKEEIDRFRKFGFQRFQVTARFILGTADEINTLMSSLKMDAPFSNIKKTPIVETKHKVADGTKPKQHGVTTYRMGPIDIVSRDKATAIEELARSKSDDLTVKCPQVEAFNGQTAMTHVGEKKRYIVGFNENDEPTINTIVEGPAFRVTPTTIDGGLLRLQCVSSWAGVAEMQTVSTSRTDSESPQRIQSPATALRRVQTTVELQQDQTLLLTGLTTTGDGKSQAVLVILDVVPISLKSVTASVRLDDNFILSQFVPFMSNTTIAYVNEKPITLDSLLDESSTALLLKHLPEMTEPDRRRIVTNAIEQSLPMYVYEEVVLQHFCPSLSAEQQAQLATAQEKRDVEVLAMLPEIMEQSKKLESQADLLATAFQQYKTRDQAANGDLSRLSRDARVARYVKLAPDTDVVYERDATLLHCRNLLLQARLRSDVSLSFSNTSLTEVLRSIAKDHGINIAVQTRLVETPATVTFHCESQPLDDALKAIVEPFGLFVRVDQEIVMIGSAATRKSLANEDENSSETTTNAPINEPSEEAVNEKHEPVTAAAAAKKPLPVAESLVLCSYPVADLVVSWNPVVVAVSQTEGFDHGAGQAVNPAAASTVAPENSPGQAVPRPISQPKDGNFIQTIDTASADFAPLVELIKATVQPDSWDTCGTLAIEREVLSLVIRQTDTAHDEIADLLSQLRNDQNANVRIQCQIVRLTNDSQIAWLDKQCSLHPLSPGSQWALLPQQRSEVFGQALLEQKPEVLSVPTVMTISGQAATIATGPSTAAETVLAGIRLEITPHLLPESKVIRLQHRFSIGAVDDAMPEPIESLVGSGQTLVLLVNAPEEKDKATAEQSHYLLMLTPEHVPLKEEEEEVVSPQPRGDANGTR